MSSQYVGLRLNYKKDKDILESLSNAKNQTKEIKRLLRIGIAATKGELATEKVVVREAKPAPKPIDWTASFANKAPVQKTDKKSIAANILGGFD